MDKLRAAYRTTVTIGLAMMATLVVSLVIVSLIEAGTIPLKGTAMMGQPLELMNMLCWGSLPSSFSLFARSPTRS